MFFHGQDGKFASSAFGDTGIFEAGYVTYFNMMVKSESVSVPETDRS